LLADLLSATDAELPHGVPQKFAVVCEQREPLRAATSKSWPEPGVWMCSFWYFILSNLVHFAKRSQVQLCVPVFDEFTKKFKWTRYWSMVSKN